MATEEQVLHIPATESREEPYLRAILRQQFTGPPDVQFSLNPNKKSCPETDGSRQDERAKTGSTRSDPVR